FLTLLASNRKFQAYVNAQDAKRLRDASSLDATASVEKILNALPSEALQRFDRLRNRCRNLRQIATDLKRPLDEDVTAAIDAIHVEGLDRLLWVFLRSLFTAHALQRFMRQTDEQAIRQDIARLNARLKDVQSESPSPRTEKMGLTLTDNLQTAESR